METDRLQEFTVVVDTGSLTKAAQQLHCTQSTLSKHVASLEHELGCALLERNANGVRPTQAGITLYGQAARILQSVQAIYDAANKSATSAANTQGSPVARPGLSSASRGAVVKRYALTPQEMECLACYLDGQSLEELAAQLQLTRDEAAQVLGGVYRKTKARGKERLARLVQLL